VFHRSEILTRLKFLHSIFTRVEKSTWILGLSMSVGFQKDHVLTHGFTPITCGIYESGIHHKWAEEIPTIGVLLNIIYS